MSNQTDSSNFQQVGLLGATAEVFGFRGRLLALHATPGGSVLAYVRVEDGRVLRDHLEHVKVIAL